MKLLISVVVAGVVSSLLYYHMFYIPLLPALADVGFIAFLVDRAASVIPAFLGVWAGIYYSISDSFISVIQRPFSKLKSDWICFNIISGYAVVQRVDAGIDDVELEVSYAGIKRTFNIDRRFFDLAGVVTGRRVGVFYNKKNPFRAYLDLHSAASDYAQNH